MPHRTTRTVNAGGLTRSVYQHLRTEVLTGQTPPGLRLAETGLARKLGISRSTVREALQRLEGDGLVERVPNVGIFVVRIDREELENLLQLREVLEGHAIERAVTRVTPEQLEELGLILEQWLSIARQVQDLSSQGYLTQHHRDLAMLDVAFHEVVLEAAQDPTLHHMAASVRDRTFLEMAPVDRALRTAAPLKVHGFHQRIYEALRAGDAAAARQASARQFEHYRQVLAANESSQAYRSETRGYAPPENWSEPLRQVMQRVL